jgi:hypothetical protein
VVGSIRFGSGSDIIDTPAGYEGSKPHTGEEIMAAVADYPAREKSVQARPQTTFAERIAHRPPEKLRSITR